MTMKCSNIINDSNNIYTLTTAWHYHKTHFALIIGLITISNTLLQLLTFKCTTVIYNFLCTIAIDYFCMHYCNWQLLFGLVQLRTIACCRPVLTTSVTLIATMHISSIQHYSLYVTCYELALWLVELLLQLQMQTKTTECSNIINYYNSNNNHTLTTA